MRESLIGPHALDPGQMTSQERIADLGDILAAGLMRLRARKSRPLSGAAGESSVDFSPDQRSHPTPRGVEKVE
jgi:hypothetical protein